MATTIHILEFGILEGIRFWMVHNHGQLLLLTTTPTVVIFDEPKMHLLPPREHKNTVSIYSSLFTVKGNEMSFDSVLELFN